MDNYINNAAEEIKESQEQTEEKQAEVQKTIVEQFTDSLTKLDKELKIVLKRNLERITLADEKLERHTRQFEKKINAFTRLQEDIKQSLDDQRNKFCGVEDTFFTLYHNIKKNQFLFAKEPEEWWKDYIDLKKHYLELNKEGEVI